MDYRREQSFNKRMEAARMAKDRPHKNHLSNGDELKFRHTTHTEDCHDGSLKDKPSYFVSFTKGLPHNKDTGLVENPDHYQFLIRGIDSGDFRDFRDTPLGTKDNVYNKYECKIPVWESDKAKTSGDNKGSVKVRAWESQSAGLSYDLEGPDAQAVTMPPAPRLGSEELCAEMGEVYGQALLRDVPFHAMSAGVMKPGGRTPSVDSKLKDLQTNKTDVKKVEKITDKLRQLDWFNGKKLKLNPAEEARRRCFPYTPSSAFRGITFGDDIGPYLSQFLLVGNAGVNGKDNIHSPADGMIAYGAIRANQKVRVATPNKDYMTQWDEWLDVQNAADLRGLESYEKRHPYRFIFTPRDLATYVHYDALYEAYLNACLILLGKGVPFDPGIPFQAADNRDHQQGFAHFGGPHILSLVTEVATRALKAVRFQKYNVHRRCRPEVLAARIYKSKHFEKMAPEIIDCKKDLEGIKLLEHVRKHNGQFGNKTELLPMAFCEGSPMHPAYGAGHATVAGACVTILKAFFDAGHPLNIVPAKEHGSKKLHDSNFAYVSVDNGKKLEVVPVLDQDCKPAKLTVEGELNKLASNISVGRNWAGVHYFTDYYESLLMGEEIAIGILQEQKLMFHENFHMSLPKFNGETIRI